MMDGKKENVEGRYVNLGSTSDTTYTSVISAVSKVIDNFQTVKSNMKNNYFIFYFF
jgi:hypothetical protein